MTKYLEDTTQEEGIISKGRHGMDDAEKRRHAAYICRFRSNNSSGRMMFGWSNLLESSQVGTV